MEKCTETDVKITLILNHDEALYLKGLIQNPLCDPNDEDQKTNNLRRSFWEALHDVN